MCWQMLDSCTLSCGNTNVETNTRAVPDCHNDHMTISFLHFSNSDLPSKILTGVISTGGFPDSLLFDLIWMVRGCEFNLVAKYLTWSSQATLAIPGGTTSCALEDIRKENQKRPIYVQKVPIRSVFASSQGHHWMVRGSPVVRTGFQRQWFKLH